MLLSMPRIITTLARPLFFPIHFLFRPFHSPLCFSLCLCMWLQPFFSRLYFQHILSSFSQQISYKCLRHAIVAFSTIIELPSGSIIDYSVDPPKPDATHKIVRCLTVISVPTYIAMYKLKYLKVNFFQLVTTSHIHLTHILIKVNFFQEFTTSYIHLTHILILWALLNFTFTHSHSQLPSFTLSSKLINKQSAQHFILICLQRSIIL